MRTLAVVALFAINPVPPVPSVPSDPPVQQRGRLSEAASVSQTVDGTKISIEYFRPRARDRQQLFGRVVHWNEIWTPGANWATTIEVNKDIKVEGRPLPKGRYSVWMVVREEGDWTLILDPRHRRFHMSRPDSTAEQIRMPVKRDSAAFTEVLTWSFPQIRADGTQLTLRWGTTLVAMNIEVTPTYPLTISNTLAEPYPGRYQYRWKVASEDTTKTLVFSVAYENGSLVGRMDPEDSYWKPYILLIRIADDWFVPGILRNGKLYDMEREVVLEFARTAGRVTGITVREEGDEIIATATRIP